jgi:DNA-directed RNA polymerase subunit RPC12/RpoP
MAEFNSPPFREVNKMSMMRCPGQDTAFWDFKAIYDVKCPKCGQPVEFFKDEPARMCKKCGYEFVNPRMDFGCAAYCKYAEQCLGSLPPELIAEKEELFKDRIAIEVKKYLGSDFKRISRTMKVARNVEQIIKSEIANPGVIISASYLKDLGANETESVIIAKEILSKLGAKEGLIEEVCNLITDLNKGIKNKTINHQILNDAIDLVEIEEKIKKRDSVDEIEHKIKHDLKTETAKKLAKKLTDGSIK